MLNYVGESWKEFKVHNSLKLRYAVSNYGRLASFTDKIKNGRILNGSKIEGYPVFAYKINVKGITKDKKAFLHKLVAENFLKKKSKDQTCVIHLDRKRENNTVENLKWVTKKEMTEHNKKSPKVIAARKKLIQFNKDRDGQKLTNKQVIQLKKRIYNPNRKTPLKIIAEQFGISEMQLFRIKSGENWGHVKV